mmetsp:Transcript_19711/g.29450  ORF Transcript_19711/g.29450 Transcript_19711/m.29450 type:complete len:316 (+) Transcript_19711:35-982(+)|eukprot:CAMPEP_0167757388 /NCGR_PEP_ID=MMETSP0110_2-20121227/9896_1 /TAXON_ID=629695 /ORGANISM="Gymnochlora sp., Strain CCMP2014" /LENGTH=315 /DNA_ID=CAMNT_0007643569 /DNA_START=41 /DNA_END=988 /DNA_ORIENTATION=+
MAEKKSSSKNVSVATILKGNAETSAAIIEAFKSDKRFEALSKATADEIKQRDAEDAKKLSVGIQLAIDKGVLKKDQKEVKAIKIDVMGKTPEIVTQEIIKALGDAPQKGCVMTLEGLSGTGKGTTVAMLKGKLPDAVTWSNGDIFRSITLLAATYTEQKKGKLEDALTPENLASFMKMLTFDKFDGAFDVKIDGLGISAMVSKVNKTLLKSPPVAKNIPTVAAKIQGEVIMFVRDALKKMAGAGKNVLVEGRAATLKYIETPHRFELVMSNETVIGQRRAAQRIGALAAKEVSGLKDSETLGVLDKVLQAMSSKL